MPGEFYIEGKQTKVDLAQVLAKLSLLEGELANPDYGLSALETLLEYILSQVGVPVGGTSYIGNTVANWQTSESEIVSISEADTQYKLQSLLLSIHNLVGTIVTVRLYMQVNGVERKVYEQVFNAVTDAPGLWIVNGTVGLYNVLRVTLQSNEAADNGQAVDYDYLLEAM
jgi:hypothetical protein